MAVAGAPQSARGGEISASVGQTFAASVRICLGCCKGTARRLRPPLGFFNEEEEEEGEEEGEGDSAASRQRWRTPRTSAAAFNRRLSEGQGQNGQQHTVLYELNGLSGVIKWEA